MPLPEDQLLAEPTAAAEQFQGCPAAPPGSPDRSW